MCKKQGGKNFMFRIHWSKPAKLQVNWVSSLGQTGSSCWLNPDLASHHCKISPSFTKASTFIGQTCNFVHLLYSSCLIFNLGDTTNPALIASIKPQNFLLLSCGAGSVHPTEVNSPSLPLLKFCRILMGLCVWQTSVNPQASPSGSDSTSTCQCARGPQFTLCPGKGSGPVDTSLVRGLPGVLRNSCDQKFLWLEINLAQ